ncbi:Uncharacterised protein [uncultured archaeon]|nr:Uncharacterised protein [uncultured archaeon]
MAYAVGMEKVQLRVGLRELGLSENQVEEICAAFDKRSKHLDVVNFVSSVERLGVPRGKVYSFLKDEGVDDSVLITVFSRVDLKKAGMDEDKMQEVAFYD